MKHQASIEQLVREARQEADVPVDLAAIEARLLARIERSEGPRLPVALPAPSPWPRVGGALALLAVAAAGLLWFRAPTTPVVAPPTVTPTIAALAPSAAPIVREFATEHQGLASGFDGLASLWVEAHSQGRWYEQDGRLVLTLDEGAVSFEVIPQPVPDRVEVRAGHLRVLVKGTRFRVKKQGDQVDVDVTHGAVHVAPLDGSGDTLLRGPTAGSFAPRQQGSLREPVAFLLGDPPPQPLPSASVADAPPRPLPPAPAPPRSDQLIREQASALAASCLHASSSLAPGVSVTIDTTLSLSVNAAGRVESFAFSPPLSPATEACVQKGMDKLRGPPGSLEIPLHLSLGKELTARPGGSPWMPLRLLSWNCFGASQEPLGALLGRAPARQRFLDPSIPTRCQDAELLCLQELLSLDACALFDRLRLPFLLASRDPNSPRLLPPSLLGSGLGLASRFPVQMFRVWNFHSSTGLDRLARKGAMHGRISLENGAVDVVNVHLQSGYTRAAAEARAAQLAELRGWLEQLGSPDRDLLLCGDFNIDGLEPARGGEYRALCAALPGCIDLGARDDLPTFHAHPQGNELAHRFEPEGWPQRLDYIFHRPASRGAWLRPVALHRVLDRPLEHTPSPRGLRHAWASDHFGLLATFTLAH
jgi:endonuclease/exonuclease/phosphatase family metal-dependent hydrolase